MKLFLQTLVLVTGLLSLGGQLSAEPVKYKFDIEGTHAFIQFKVKHLGFSWLLGGFNQFDGRFTFDEENPKNSKVEVNIETKSLDTNHAERDKHLRDADFFSVKKFPEATFVSKSVEITSEQSGKIMGDLTLKGITKPVMLEVNHIGGGKDPWGGFRQGFEAKTTIKLSDFGFTYDLGPASTEAEIYISVEGIRI